MRTILFLLLTTTCAMAGDSSLTGYSLMTTSNLNVINIAPPHLSYYGKDQKLIFDIAPDGTVKLGDGIKPDAASVAFWDAVQAMGLKLTVCPKKD